MKQTTYQPDGGGAKSIRVTAPVLRSCPAGMEYTFSIWLDRGQGRALLIHTVSFSADVEIDPVEGLGTAALSATIVPAMRMGLPLHIEAPVSPKLLENLDEFQDIFASWFDVLQKVEVHAPLAGLDLDPSPAADDRGVGSWFSLGVDGFDTYLRHADRISHLLFIHGFDIDVEKHAHRLAVQDALESTAREIGKPLVTIQTNARSFSDDYLWWGHYLGSMMGAAGQLLSGQLREILWASSADYFSMPRFGTSPLSDPYLSSDAMRVVHDGCGSTRMEKVEAIAASGFALRHLRVCWGQEGNPNNCGRCEKCLRTMTALSFMGMLDQASTFPGEIDLELIRREKLVGAHTVFMREFREKAREVGQLDAPIMQAWEQAARNGAAGAVGDIGQELADPAVLASLKRPDRDQLFEELRKHAPGVLADQVAKHTGRAWREVFDHLWDSHRGVLRKAILRGGGPKNGDSAAG